MNNINYNKIMEETIKELNYKPKLLLHICCAPCSSSVIERLIKFFNITIYFYNPNISTNEEYIKRQNEAIRLIKELNKQSENKINVITNEFNSKIFYEKVKGYENCLEGGDRCKLCFELRLENTCKFAKENNFDYFTTTLSVSPHKNSKILNEIGSNLQEKYGIKYLFSDFKKKDGYKRSIELSKIYNLYRQNFCGCIFSKSVIK